MAFEDSPLGLFYIATRRMGEMIYLRQNEIFLPHADWVNGLEDAAGEIPHAAAGIDRAASEQQAPVALDESLHCRH